MIVKVGGTLPLFFGNKWFLFRTFNWVGGSSVDDGSNFLNAWLVVFLYISECDFLAVVGFESVAINHTIVHQIDDVDFVGMSWLYMYVHGFRVSIGRPAIDVAMFAFPEKHYIVLSASDICLWMGISST